MITRIIMKKNLQQNIYIYIMYILYKFFFDILEKKMLKKIWGEREQKIKFFCWITNYSEI